MQKKFGRVGHVNFLSDEERRLSKHDRVICTVINVVNSDVVNGLPFTVPVAPVFLVYELEQDLKIIEIGE